MKKIIFLFCFSIATTSFSQDQYYVAPEKDHPLMVDGKLPIDSIFSDKENNVLFSEVFKVDGLSQKQLIAKVKNWASTKFVNLKEVLVSETEDQIVLVYIDKSFYNSILLTDFYWSWYIRLVFQFKDGKIKATYSDDGNVYEPSTKYVDARSVFLKTYFKEKKGQTFAKTSSLKGLIALKESIVKNFNTLKTELSKKDNNDW